MGKERIDPSDPALREELLEQINRLANESRPARRRRLLKAGRILNDENTSTEEG